MRKTGTQEVGSFFCNSKSGDKKVNTSSKEEKEETTETAAEVTTETTLKPSMENIYTPAIGSTG